MKRPIHPKPQDTRAKGYAIVASCEHEGNGCDGPVWIYITDEGVKYFCEVHATEPETLKSSSASKA